jgi:hypothetical protein
MMRWVGLQDASVSCVALGAAPPTPCNVAGPYVLQKRRWCDYGSQRSATTRVSTTYNDHGTYSAERSGWDVPVSHRLSRPPALRHSHTQSNNRQFFLSMQDVRAPADALRLLAAYDQQLLPRHVSGLLLHIVALLQHLPDDSEDDSNLVAYGVDSTSGVLEMGGWQAVIAQLSAWVHQHMDSLYYQHLASIVWAWAKLGWQIQHQEQQHQLVEQVLQQKLDPGIVGAWHNPAYPLLLCHLNTAAASAMLPWSLHHAL